MFYTGIFPKIQNCERVSCRSWLSHYWLVTVLECFLAHAVCGSGPLWVIGANQNRIFWQARLPVSFLIRQRTQMSLFVIDVLGCSSSCYFMEVFYNNFRKKKKLEKEKVMFSCRETKEKSWIGILNCNKAQINHSTIPVCSQTFYTEILVYKC